jgi:hypothetical protein
MIPLHRADWLFAAAVVLVVVGVSLLPSPRDRNPGVPATPEHRGLSERDCVRCHAAGQSRPLSDRHPRRQDCFRCHKGPDAAGGKT